MSNDYGKGYGYGYRYADQGGISTAAIVSHIHPYWTGIKKFWWIPLILAAVAAGGMLAYVEKLPPPPFTSFAAMSISVRSAADNVVLSVSDDLAATQTEIMTSPEMKRRTDNKVQAMYPGEGVCQVAIKVSAAPRSGLFQMEASGTQPTYVQKFLDTFMDEFLQLRSESRATNLERNIIAIQNQLSSDVRELTEKTRKLNEFQKKNSIELLREKAVSSGGLYARLSSNGEDLRLELELLKKLSLEQQLDRESRIGRASSSGGKSTKSASKNGEKTSPDPDDPIVSKNDSLMGIYAARQSLELLRFQQLEYAKDLKPKHPKMVDLDLTIKRTEKTLSLLTAEAEEQIESRKRRVELEAAFLKEQIAQAERKAEEAGVLIAEHEQLKSEVTQLIPRIERLRESVRTMELRDALTIETLSRVRAASEAVQYPIKKLPRLIIAASGGLILGISIIALVVFLDDRIKSLTALKAAFQEPIVGQVPEVRPKVEGQMIELLSEGDERHSFAESFRNIRSSLLFMEEENQRPKTIIITSSIPEEGKSSVSANLARTMAFSGSKVLLVDGDQRRCSLNEKLKMPMEPGFSDVLTKKMKLEDVVLQTDVPNLWFLPRGTAIKNPGELFVGSPANDFLRDVYDKYDFILIDTPPVLAADDTTSLAPKVDGVLFVLRGEFTSARLARESLELLYNRHTRVLGLVYNRANLFLPEYSYYKYASYYQTPDADAAKAAKKAGKAKQKA